MATRWGICSAGKISHDFVVALKTLPREEHQVVAVAARELGWAQDFANRHDIPRAYGSYQELAQDKDIDVVYLGTIHPQHHPVGLLFLRAKKNLLCEKPLAMNMREVLELTAAARENDVFLMEALWTRYFPASIQISDVLAQGVLGEVKLVRVEFGMPMLDVSRAVKKELGGGALLDIGVYCLQFACMVFNGERPESIQASGCLLDTGLSLCVCVCVCVCVWSVLCVCLCDTGLSFCQMAFIFGTKGTIKIPAPMWSPTSLIVNGNETQFPLPEPSQPLNFPNSTGLRYEAQEVRRCLLAGLKQSPRMTLEDTALLTSICDEARRQVGVVYCQDAE
ncbi:trans-1,2-dihydrobenzene-1,2-diol dehydrogenase-like isoform X1 [Huso huso]|uniref:Trans-1,2-dihydrobenzene-1,2-diol dehydrogenase n=1 Tax=Huso huso TaxID=61971 RepID=A0ABR0YSA0_HUSHU